MVKSRHIHKKINSTDNTNISINSTKLVPLLPIVGTTEPTTVPTSPQNWYHYHQMLQPIVPTSHLSSLPVQLHSLF